MKHLLLIRRPFSQKVIPRFQKYGQIKLNFKDLVSQLPLITANVKNRLSCKNEWVNPEAKPDWVAALYSDYVKKRYEIDQVRRLRNQHAAQ